MSTFIILLLICILLIVMDVFWFQFSGATYGAATAAIQGSPMVVRWEGGLVAWSLIAAGLWYFARDWRDGAMLGLVTYGVYNATNYALLKDYPLKVAMMDTAWGVLACGVGGAAAGWLKG
jgi:uncharacterized membrane protein